MCCISLACNVHRDTPRIVDYCSGKLQRGTCAKNTINVNKNDPNLTCPQCTIRSERYNALLPLVDMKFETGADFNSLDDGDIGESCPQECIIQPLPDEECQDSSTAQSCPPLPSMESGLPPDPHFAIDEFALLELSYEDGLRLIDETFSAEHINCTVKDMGTDENEMCFIPIAIDLDPEQMYGTIDGNTQNSQIDVTTDTIYLFQQHCPPSYDLDIIKEITTEADMAKAREFLLRARQELEMLRSIQQDMEPNQFTQLKSYFTSSQILVYSGS